MTQALVNRIFEQSSNKSCSVQFLCWLRLLEAKKAQMAQSLTPEPLTVGASAATWLLT